MRVTECAGCAMPATGAGGADWTVESMRPERNPDRKYVQTGTRPLERQRAILMGKKHLSDAAESIEECDEGQSLLGRRECGQPGDSSALPSGGVAVAGKVAHQAGALC
jgi:hypothetical protein